MAALNTEEENYVRMSLLLTGVAQRAVRAYFDQLFPPVDLASTLNQEYVHLSELKTRQRFINQTQWNLLFPANGQPNSTTFDVTLMICLIRNLKSITQPQCGYDNKPLATETFPAADLARIKYYRNYLAHLDVGSVDSSTFNTSWTELKHALQRLGGSSMHQECEDLKTKILDQSNQEVMLEIRLARTEMDCLKQSLDSIETSHVKLKASYDNLKESHDNLKESHSAVENELSTLQKETIPWNIRG